jgi:SAM-dependent methyltransferase
MPSRFPTATAHSTIARVLRPGGSLYVSTPNIRFAGYLRRLLLDGRFPLTSGDPCGFQGGHLHFFTFKDVDDLLRAEGFDAIEHEGLVGGRLQRLMRVVPRSLAREFLSVAVFVIAKRAPGPVPRAEQVRERRSEAPDEGHVSVAPVLSLTGTPSSCGR